MKIIGKFSIVFWCAPAGDEMVSQKSEWKGSDKAENKRWVQLKILAGSESFSASASAYTSGKRHKLNMSIVEGGLHNSSLLGYFTPAAILRLRTLAPCH